MKPYGPGPISFASEIHNLKRIQQNEKANKKSNWLTKSERHIAWLPWINKLGVCFAFHSLFSFFKCAFRSNAMQGVNFDFCFLKHQLEAEQLSLLKFVPFYELWSVRRSGREKSLLPGQLPTVRLANTFNGEKYFPLFTHSISPSPKSTFSLQRF